mmetsp:Transcript_62938/g.153253  ORF Transcript_62938/g.153253 Transcript_62938/m.153253 type:complete len:138 (-) Transcript_62938:65-478(-)|eukprot:CAMPEP_0113471426 /NCGR_PEP_ID=MMETSP0014_2-20120614/16970_1 /TAXON_ID=2857 /ORGANISM="Nitzschia sp." /LENGTH=137 /DNA_ID=CAMNT_0000364057 /DNA_START=793 /DNA_END=1203 /DNA_ORIENTATION=- /assembly_acc=CAM_ASM_000159
MTIIENSGRDTSITGIQSLQSDAAHISSSRCKACAGDDDGGRSTLIAEHVPKTNRPHHGFNLLPTMSKTTGCVARFSQVFDSPRGLAAFRVVYCPANDPVHRRIHQRDDLDPVVSQSFAAAEQDFLELQRRASLANL